MKKILLLPLLAFIFLCSCKSSSFMTQRYTKLGHKHNSSKNENVATKTIRKSNLETQKSALVKADEKDDSVIVALTTFDNSSVSAGARPVFFPKKLIKPLVSKGSMALTAIQTDYQKTKSEKVGQEKTFKQKVHKAAGLLNTVFKIVLFAIILAILVAVIIIIILT